MKKSIFQKFEPKKPVFFFFNLKKNGEIAIYGYSKPRQSKERPQKWSGKKVSDQYIIPLLIGERSKKVSINDTVVR